MKIIKITSQHRRDFWADLECEGCGHIEKDVSGYDDSYFHNEVIPGMKCPKCGKNRAEMGIVGEKTTTKYPEWMQV